MRGRSIFAPDRLESGATYLATRAAARRWVTRICPFAQRRRAPAHTQLDFLASIQASFSACEGGRASPPPLARPARFRRGWRRPAIELARAPIAAPSARRPHFPRTRGLRRSNLVESRRPLPPVMAPERRRGRGRRQRARLQKVAASARWRICEHRPDVNRAPPRFPARRSPTSGRISYVGLLVARRPAGCRDNIAFVLVVVPGRHYLPASRTVSQPDRRSRRSRTPRSCRRRPRPSSRAAPSVATGPGNSSAKTADELIHVSASCLATSAPSEMRATDLLPATPSFADHTLAGMLTRNAKMRLQLFFMLITVQLLSWPRRKVRA